jgi:D-alanyl-D-alanine carboxypeptidase
MKLVSPDGSSQLILNRHGQKALIPASTLKLFTGWMALNDGRFTQEDIGLMLKKSGNREAQSMFTQMGGVKKLEAFLRNDQKLPLTSKNFIAVDGSGLSKTNRTTCDLQVQLLEKILADPLYSTYKLLLAEPGQEGTLEKRLLDLSGALFAKTGTLRTTIGLSGYVELPQGTAVFCILSQNFSGTWDQERARVDALLIDQLKTINP